jgi:rhodanese-related sulfurtransferase
MKDFDLQLALNLLKKHNAILLDIRTRKEFCQGHIVGAMLVPTQLPPLSERELKNLKQQLWYTLRHYERSTPIVLYCKKGVRAKIAKRLVQELGFPNVTALGGVEEPPLKAVFSGTSKGVFKICKCRA